MFVYIIENIFSIVQTHDAAFIDVDNCNVERNTDDNEQQTRIKFRSPHLIGVSHNQGEADFIKSSTLDYPITIDMILDFLKQNRNFFQQEKAEKVSFNKDGIGKSPDDYPPLLLETFLMEVSDDCAFFEFRHKNSDYELVWAIILNKTRKRIIVVFRGSVTITDWKKNLLLHQVSTKFIRSFAGKGTKIHSGYSNYLLDPSGTKDGKMSTFDNIVEIINEIRSTKDQDGNYLYRDYSLKTTGFSLGGAMAQLFLFVVAKKDEIEDLPLPLTAVTYASPPVGNYGYLKEFKNMEMSGRVRHVRITNEGDVVPCFRPQCGMSIHLYPNVKAKVKFSDMVDFGARALRTAKVMGPAESHQPETYRARLLLDINSDIISKDVEDIYVESGALKRLSMRSMKCRILKTKFTISSGLSEWKLHNAMRNLFPELNKS